MSRHPVHVYKFGGTSVATPERIRRVVDLVRSEPETVRRVVVVSALGGVTDQLLQAIEEARERTGTHRALLEALWARHEAALRDLARPEEQAALHDVLLAHWRNLTELLDGVSLLRECTMRSRDAIIGTGERLAAPLVAAAFRAAGLDAADHDATHFIRTDDAFGEATVQWAETQRLIRDHFAAVPPGQIAVVTGFIAATERGVTTTLGRSGSDYTATILGGALQAERVVIWTDVDGVLSADPRLVPGAFTLPELSYREAAELAYFGAKVLHPRTMRPLIEAGIPLQIKNTLNPAAPGTLIRAETTLVRGHVKAVTSIQDVAMVMIEGTGMMGVPGISARAFGALANQQVNVLMISQASSEQSICIVVREGDAGRAEKALRLAFDRELDRGDVSRIYTIPGCSVLAVVGDRMRQQPGLAGRMFSTLGRANINVLAIAQGATETNISAVVRRDEVRKAVRALHEAFARQHERVHLCLIGPGSVGRALLRQLAVQAPVLLESLGLHLRLVGVANSQRLLWDEEGLAFDTAADRLREAGEPLPLDAVVERVVGSHLERVIVIDATASEAVARRYADLLAHGIGIVTPNKRANAIELAYYETLQWLARKHEVPYRYETTVGAALPVLSTLRDLIRAGDRVHRVEAVLSGTLAFVFNRMAAGAAFSEAVRAARDRGFTEPDPRDDLGGEDVARKLLVIAREAGLPVERADMTVASLVPEALRDVPVDTFLARLGEEDDAWAERMRRAGRMHFVARLDDGRLHAGVEPVSPASPLARLDGTDNMVVFTTDRYRERPLVIQGPGAGPELTAAGLVADLVRAARAMA
ncbi:MAG: bifunctional aspartokinase I/homoserine dehydrogenase I [Rhodothermaceae bacterium]|nr:MAG: bifunctional aspartokinase I/homoserine dehydrogenase I [Rhodothermaceae bacterium]